MTTTERDYDALVRTWIGKARERRGKHRTAAWHLALDYAQRCPERWLVLFLHHETQLPTSMTRLVEITRVGPSGAVYGRAHYASREPGIEKVWRRSRRPAP